MGQSKSAESRYSTKARLAQERLVPGQRLRSQDLSRVDASHIFILGNSRLRPECFHLRGVDVNPLDSLLPPGRSGMIDFLGLGQGADLTREDKDFVTRLAFNKPPDRRDCVWYTEIPRVEECNYAVFYAPVRGNGLHIRLVHNSHIPLSPPIDTLPQPPRFNLNQIRAIWRRQR